MERSQAMQDRTKVAIIGGDNVDCSVPFGLAELPRLVDRTILTKGSGNAPHGI